jgi:hypothetical protein
MKHLEFIQGVIRRMNTNSFLLKGWTITIVAALLALSDNANRMHLAWIVYVAMFLFWILDGFHISQERQYRALYDKIRKTAETEIDFDMDASMYNNKNRTWLRGIFSGTLVLFYGLSLAFALALIYFTKLWPTS